MDINKSEKEPIYFSKSMLMLFFAVSQSTEAIFASCLPSIANSMGIIANTAQYIAATGFVGLSFGILIFGRLSDVIGRRPVMIIGFSLYIIFTFYILLLDNVYELIICRALQSFGISVGSCVSQAIARDVFRGRALSYAYSSIAVGLAVFPALAASVGGFIGTINWKYNMAIMEIISISILVLIIFFMPETNNIREDTKSTSYLKVLKKMLKDPKVWCYICIIGCTNSILYGFFIEAPFIIMRKFKLSPGFYSLMIMSMSSVLFVSGLFNTKLIKTVHASDIMKYGAIISVTSSLTMMISAIIFDDSKELLFLGLIIFSRWIFLVSHSFIVPHCLRFALEDYTEYSGTAGSIFGFGYYIFIALSNTLIAKLHSDENILLFSTQLFILSLIIIILVYKLRSIGSKEVKIKVPYY